MYPAPPNRALRARERTFITPVQPGGTLFGRLADRFECYARVLDYARRVHFRSAPSLPFFA